jgi:homocysteine S-methyltransferase
VLSRLKSHHFLTVAELNAPTGGTPDRALRDAALLKKAGCDAVLIGGSSGPRPQVSPISLAVLIQQRIRGLEALLNVFTWEKSVMTLQADLLGAYAFGVRHVLCRSGSPPLLDARTDAVGSWEVDSVGLMRLLEGLNQGRDSNDIPLAQPTAFVIGASINPTSQEFEQEVEGTRRKIAAGADFLITSALYDIEALRRLLAAVNMPEDLPIILGVMPLADFNHAEYLHQEVPGIEVPDEVLLRMRRAGTDGGGVGLQIARELIAEARGLKQVQGVLLTSAGGQAQELVELVQNIATAGAA